MHDWIGRYQRPSPKSAKSCAEAIAAELVLIEAGLICTSLGQFCQTRIEIATRPAGIAWATAESHAVAFD